MILCFSTGQTRRIRLFRLLPSDFFSVAERSNQIQPNVHYSFHLVFAVMYLCTYFEVYILHACTNLILYPETHV